MRLVVGNLLDNAVKYSYDDTYIRVTAQREDRTIHVTVENMGTGIAEAELEKIFEPFYRAEHRDPRRLIWGSGLGLSVAREIVGAHGGRIWAESEAGGRSADETAQYVGFKNVFHFTLPFRGKGEHGE